jgi:hypothetical protein
MSNRSVFDVASLFHPNLCQQAVKTATVAHWDVGAKPSRAARCAQRESTANNSTSRLHVASAQMWPPTPIHQVLVPLPAQCARPPWLQHHLAKPAVSWLGCTPVFLRVPEGTPACAFMIPATEPCMSTRDTRRILYAILAALGVVCLTFCPHSVVQLQAAPSRPSSASWCRPRMAAPLLFKRTPAWPTTTTSLLSRVWWHHRLASRSTAHCWCAHRLAARNPRATATRPQRQTI